MGDESTIKNTAQPPNNPLVSAVICTRNRGSRIVETVESIFTNTHPNFELLVIDQSTNTETQEALQSYLADSRFRYFHSSTKGTGLSRNIGLNLARADFVVFTDDDCIVSNIWLSAMEQVFNTYPKVAVVYCSVKPGPHNLEEGTIPCFEYKQDHKINSIVGYYKSIGMGAGMAVRKSAVIGWGGFDDAMGPGSSFQCGEDHDLALRALRNHCSVYELSQESVIHNGYRTFQEYRILIARDMYGLGAAHAKFVKNHDIRIMVIILYSILYRCLWQPLTVLIKYGKFQGFRRIVYYLNGFINGLWTPIDKYKLVYRVSN